MGLLAEHEQLPGPGHHIDRPDFIIFALDHDQRTGAFGRDRQFGRTEDGVADLLGGESVFVDANDLHVGPCIGDVGEISLRGYHRECTFGNQEEGVPGDIEGLQ